MKKPHVFVVGKAFADVFEVFERCGVNVGAFVDDASNTPLPDYVSPVYRVPFSSSSALSEALQTLKPIHPDALFGCYENAITVMAEIGNALDVSTISIEAARFATNKYLMRQRFAAFDPSISPDSALVTSQAELDSFVDTHHFPLILKPANLVKSLMVKKCNTHDELYEHFTHMQKNLATLYTKESVKQAPTIIVEEFMIGSFHSVDALVDRDGVSHFLPIVDLVMGNERDVDDNHNFKRSLPSALSDSAQKAVFDAATKGIKALGLTNIPAHVEVVRMPSGVKIIEIGARMGGYRPRMHRLANNIDYIGAYVNLLLDRPYSLKSTKHEYCAVYEIFPDNEGVFSHIAHADIISRLPSCTYYREKVKSGATVGLARNGYRRCAIAILSNADAEQFKKDCSLVEKQVQVILAS